MVALGAWLEIWSDDWLPVWNWLGCGDFQLVPYPCDLNSPAHVKPLRGGILRRQSVGGHCSHFTQQARCFNGVFQPKEPKSFPMQNHRASLDPVIDLGSFKKAVYIIPREASRQKVMVDLQRALDSEIMTQAQAAQTRGRSDWVGTNSFERLGRLGLAVFKHLQYHVAGSLSNFQRNALRFHQRVMASMPQRRIEVGHAPDTPSQVLDDRRELVGFCSEWETNQHWRRPLFWNSASLKRGAYATDLPCRKSGHCDWHLVDAQTSHPKGRDLVY